MPVLYVRFDRNFDMNKEVPCELAIANSRGLFVAVSSASIARFIGEMV